MQRETMGLSGIMTPDAKARLAAVAIAPLRAPLPHPAEPSVCPAAGSYLPPAGGAPGTLAFRSFIHSDDTASPQRALTNSGQ
jgi:hypothetical protein